MTSSFSSSWLLTKKMKWWKKNHNLTVCLQPGCFLIVCQIQPEMFLKNLEISKNTNNPDKAAVRWEAFFQAYF